jgi:predicted RNase H-like nuclease
MLNGLVCALLAYQWWRHRAQRVVAAGA